MRNCEHEHELNKFLALKYDLFDFFLKALILASPLIVYGFEISGISIRLSRLILVFITPLLMLRVIQKPDLLARDRFFVFVLVPFSVYSLSSMFWSSELYAPFSRFGGLIEIILVYAIMVVADLRSGRFLSFAHYYLFGSMIPIGFALWQISNNIFQFSTAELPLQTLLIGDKYDVLQSRYFFADSEYTRISSTFAEPVIFSNYLCSVFLVSLVLNVKGIFLKIGLTIFRILMIIMIILSVSKLSILSLIIGVLAVGTKNKKVVRWLFYSSVFFMLVFGLVAYFDFYGFFERLFSETGHFELLKDTLATLPTIDYIFGQGFGSLEHGSTHRFILSRVYETGLIGLFLSISVTLLPIVFSRLKVAQPNSGKIKHIGFGVLLSIIFGLNAYDFFIHLFPWIVIGATMSFYNAERKVEVYV